MQSDRRYTKPVTAMLALAALLALVLPVSAQRGFGALGGFGAARFGSRSFFMTGKSQNRFNVLNDRVAATHGLGRSAFQQHHVIPFRLRNHSVLQRTSFNINSYRNRAILPTSRSITHRDYRFNRAFSNWSGRFRSWRGTRDRSIHMGGHGSSRMRMHLNRMERVGARRNWSNAEYQRRVSNLISRERRNLLNGTVRLNRHFR